MAISRKNIKPEVIYYDQKADMYFWSPDGDGGYWYDTLEECVEQHGEGRVTVVSKILDY